MPDSRMPHDNAPAGSRRHDEPRNWSDAFAALPLETPPRDAWAKVAAELRATVPTKRDYRPWWMALAAAVALAIALPLAWLPHGGEAPPNVAVQPAGTAPDAHAGESPSTMAVESPGKAPATEPASAPVHVARTPARPKATPAPAAKQPASDAATLASLYAQSEQLEGLLARMRDDRMSSGPAAVLADHLETRVALIDATLAEPALDDARRSGLWRERVDALRQLAGFESTQRWLAAQGESYDARLVAVY